MKRFCLFLLIALAPGMVHAQTNPDGAWTLSLTPPNGMDVPPMAVKASTVDDSLHLALDSPHGEMSLEDVALVDESLHFVIPTDHGRIVCNVYRQAADAFQGTCEGPMGEFPAVLERRASSEGP